jgi:hypothetical protein
MKKIIIIIMVIFLFVGCATTGVTIDDYSKTGPHYFKQPEPEGEKTVGHITGMLEGAAIGMLLGGGAGAIGYNVFSGNNITFDVAAFAAYLSVGAVILGTAGGIIGWNLPYLMIGAKTEEDKKKEREKQEEEKLRDLFKDK